MSRLRTYAPMPRRSSKVKDGTGAFQAVYREVDQRSEGRCECAIGDVFGEFPLPQCTHRATDHHHVLKPRRVYHNANSIVHLCRHHHDRCTWPFKRGRLVVTILGNGRFTFSIKFASDKFAARGDA
jgi:hypothetical protein